MKTKKYQAQTGLFTSTRTTFVYDASVDKFLKVPVL